MATNYSYVERDAADYINWAEVGKTMSDMLNEQARIREDQKAKIDEDARKSLIDIANAPQGQDKSANAYALEYSQNASNYLLQQQRLLKSGQLNVKDYIVSRQNIMDGTDMSFNALKTYQSRYAEVMERARTDKSALYELDQWKRAEGFGDFGKSGLYINPINGMVNVAMKDENGRMKTDAGSFTTVSSLNALLQGRWDKFDTNTETDKFAKSLGTYTDMLRNVGGAFKAGELITVKDITKRKDLDQNTRDVIFEFQKAEEAGLNAILSNDFSRMSVLTDSVKFAPNGKQYRFTRDAADAAANPEAILMVADSKSGTEKPQFSEDQMSVSLDFLRDEARRKYDIDRKIDTYTEPQQYAPRPTQAESEAGQKRKSLESNVGYWNQAFTGDNARKNQAIQNLLGTDSAKEAGITNIDLSTKGQIVVTYLPTAGVPNNSRTIPYDAENIDLEGWGAIGSEITGLSDKNVIKKLAGKNAGMRLTDTNSDFSGVKASRDVSTATKPETKEEKNLANRAKYNDVVSEITSDIFEMKQDQAVEKLKPILEKLGVTVTPTGSVSNYITVQAKGQKPKEIGTNAYTTSGGLGFMSKLIDYLNEAFKDDSSLESAFPTSRIAGY